MRRMEAFHGNHNPQGSELQTGSFSDVNFTQSGMTGGSETLQEAPYPYLESPLMESDGWQADRNHESEAWQQEFVPASADWMYFEGYPDNEDTGSGESAGYEPFTPAQAPKEKKPFSSLSLVVSLLSLGVMLACGVFILRASGSQAAFDEKLRLMQGKQFFEGITINNRLVSGQTPLQLRTLPFEESSQARSLGITLKIDNESILVTNEHIKIESNLEGVMEEAWSIGRQGAISVINSSFTPFEGRYRQVQHVKKYGAAFHTKASYQKSAVTRLSEDLASQFNREPVNAVIASFDFATKKFSVTQDVKGRRIEASELEDAIVSALDAGKYQTEITLSSTAVLPKVSSIELTNGFTKLSSFSTRTGSDGDRNNNIILAASAINNQTLMPGMTFSFNETTGQRTIQKGYKGAPAIQGGVLIDDVGGGVCQVSSTLFAAAAQADMAIVERSPHAWPVSYMDKGMDATVNWPNLDFKFKNNKDTPVFIIASYENRTLTIEFYGMQSAPGESVRLETELISTTRPPSEPVYQQNVSLPFNTQKELKQARDGYVVDTFRVYLRNGSEIRREKLFTSRYKEVQQVIEYN